MELSSFASRRMVGVVLFLLTLAIGLSAAPPSAHAQVLGPAGTNLVAVEGRVLTASGQPVAGVFVRAYPSGQVATTGADGVYRLTVPAGRIELVPDSHGGTMSYTPPVHRLAANRDIARADFTAATNSSSSRFPRRTVVGRVTAVLNNATTPLRGIPIQCGRRTVRTNADGRYVCSVSENELPLTIRPLAPSRTSIRSFTPESAQVSVGALEASFVANIIAYPVSGRVVNRFGDAISGATVEFRVRYGLTTVQWATQTGADGRFAIQDIPPGFASVTVRVHGARAQTMMIRVDSSINDFTIVVRSQ